MNVNNLVSVANMFDSNLNGTSLRGDIPPLLFRTCTKLQDISNVFAYCTLLTGGLDSQLFANNGRLTNTQEAFVGCNNLKGELSANLFTFSKNPNITNFGGTINGCSKLTGSAQP